NLVPQDLFNRFINEESRLAGPPASYNKIAPIKKTLPLQAHASMALGSSVSSDIICHYCKKPGHKKPDCYKLKWDQKNTRKGKAGQQGKAAQNTITEALD